PARIDVLRRGREAEYIVEVLKVVARGIVAFDAIAVGAEPQAAAAIFADGADVVAHLNARRRRIQHTAELRTFRIGGRDSRAVAADPEQTRTIDDQARDVVVGQGTRHREVVTQRARGAVGRVVDGEAVAEYGEPQASMAILHGGA